ncbi:MAG: hypothetical protein CSA21_00825 [Deltaproteobacteria bacterium]|nr:MAG: hypothetical protein CSA21_00825 [Deltaproteobacteria bacterium]
MTHSLFSCQVFLWFETVRHYAEFRQDLVREPGFLKFLFPKVVDLVLSCFKKLLIDLPVCRMEGVKKEGATRPQRCIMTLVSRR